MPLEIPLTKGQVAIVDDVDAGLANLKWYAYWNPTAKTHYAVRTELNAAGNRRQVYMHRRILGVTDPSILVDHRNHIGTDNRRHNLRPCTPKQNQSNRRSLGGVSEFKGVFWNKEINKWFAQIKTDSKQIYLGSFSSELDAANAYDKAAIEDFGEFAYLNNALRGVA